MDAGPSSNGTGNINKINLFGRVGVNINSSHFLTKFDNFEETTNNM